MNIRLKRSARRKVVYFLIFFASFGYAAKPSISDEFTDRRLTAGAKIFRALLAADIDITRKTREDGSLGICLLYVNDPTNAEKVASTLRNRDDSRVRNLDIISEIQPLTARIYEPLDRFAAIFITQNLSDEKLALIISWAKTKNMVVFSPFEGDVERWVQSGLAVEARVRPFLNTKALYNADIKLKSFFIRVSKRYEK